MDCEYPRWVEFLCHDISVHVPHHVNSKIPWYNLRAANDSLKQNWGQYMTSCTFNWRMMKTIFTGEWGWGGCGVECFLSGCAARARCVTYKGIGVAKGDHGGRIQRAECWEAHRQRQCSACLQTILCTCVAHWCAPWCVAAAAVSPSLLTELHVPSDLYLHVCC